MYKSILISILCVISITIYSQQTITISGYVKSKKSYEVLIGASIYSPLHKKGTSTNDYGFYSLTLPYTDSVELHYGFTGFERKKTVVSSKSIHQMHNVFLNEGVLLKEFSVTDNEILEINNPDKSIKLEIEDVKKLPNFFGEVDIIKAYQFTPGVQSGGEARSDFFVRGGSSDQNLILLDDVPLYNISHFGGFLSVFNADAINSVKLLKGGFPAQYSSRLSSVLDVKMKEGNMNKTNIQGTLGLLSSKITFSTPIIKKKMSVFTSLRGSLIPYFSLFGTGISYNFYDVNTKINYILSKKDRLFFSFYRGEDILSINNNSNEKGSTVKDKSSLRWGNMLISSRWNHIFSTKLFSNLTIYNTRYKYSIIKNYNFENNVSKIKQDKNITTKINDFGLKYDFSYFRSSSYTLKFGINHIYHNFNPNDENFHQKGTNLITINDNYKSNIPVQESGIYAENHFKYKRFFANIGVRSSNFNVSSVNYFSIEPRVSLNYLITNQFSFNYSYAKMNQFIHLLSNSNVGLPTDFWMPSTENVKPENSIQRTIGLSFLSKKNNYKISLEGYYKTMTNLIAFLPGKSLETTRKNWEKTLATEGNGLNYGLELFLQKIKGKTTGWISGTLSRALRKFNKINNGEFFPFKYDRLLNVSIVLIHKFNKNISISSTWNYGTGYPTTLATDMYKTDDGLVLLYGKTNNYRMENYHRLDISANFSKKMIWGGTRTWSFSIYNIYNRQNPYYYFYQNDYKIIDNSIELSSVKLFQQTLFGFFPSLAFSVKF